MCPKALAPPWRVVLDWSGVWPGNWELSKIPRRFSRAVQSGWQNAVEMGGLWERLGFSHWAPQEEPGAPAESEAHRDGRRAGSRPGARAGELAAAVMLTRRAGGH